MTIPVTSPTAPQGTELPEPVPAPAPPAYKDHGEHDSFSDGALPNYRPPATPGITPTN